jgi:hypothetical protein
MHAGENSAVHYVVSMRAFQVTIVGGNVVTSSDEGFGVVTSA